MDIVTTEQALTAWIAERLGMTVDNGIYRGGIPENCETGIGVTLDTDTKDLTLLGRTCRAQILGKYADRDSALALIENISNLVPAWDVTKNSVIFKVILPGGGTAPSAVTDDGQTRFLVTIHLTAVVLTTDAEV